MRRHPGSHLDGLRPGPALLLPQQTLTASQHHSFAQRGSASAADTAGSARPEREGKAVHRGRSEERDEIAALLGGAPRTPGAGPAARSLLFLGVSGGGDSGAETGLETRTALCPPRLGAAWRCGGLAVALCPVPAGSRSRTERLDKHDCRAQSCLVPNNF